MRSLCHRLAVASCVLTRSNLWSDAGALRSFDVTYAAKQRRQQRKRAGQIGSDAWFIGVPIAIVLLAFATVLVQFLWTSWQHSFTTAVMMANPPRRAEHDLDRGARTVAIVVTAWQRRIRQQRSDIKS